MDAILNIIIIILILGVIIFVHELGHLIASKIFKVYVEEFAIGMGPKILGKKIGETLYTLRLFPIGGYNKIKGEEYEEDDKDPRSLRNQKAYVRIIIFLSGVFMNVLLAILIFYGLIISMDFNFP
jgi:regulator of sigma E protease